MVVNTSICSNYKVSIIMGLINKSRDFILRTRCFAANRYIQQKPPANITANCAPHGQPPVFAGTRAFPPLPFESCSGFVSTAVIDPQKQGRNRKAPWSMIAERDFSRIVFEKPIILFWGYFAVSNFIVNLAIVFLFQDFRVSTKLVKLYF